MPSPSEAHIHLDLAPTRTDAVTATLTGNDTVLAHAVLTSYGFRETGPDTLILARIDHEEPYCAAQAAKALEYAGLPVTVTPALQEEIDTEWDWAFHPMPWCTRAEVREVSAEAQEIFDDIGSGRLVIHQHYRGSRPPPASGRPPGQGPAPARPPARDLPHRRPGRPRGPPRPLPRRPP
ncbi:hypothetical protein ABZ569_10780 [Streptomyces albus]|uniref:hypothetical protein n=1 Tax=Streptomyces albus TaxID=1888 RepID=UPI0033C96D0D